jgi:hypothetical protein
MGSSVRGFAVDWQWVLAPVFADMQPGMLLLQIGREHSDGQKLSSMSAKLCCWLLSSASRNLLVMPGKTG